MSNCFSIYYVNLGPLYVLISVDSKYVACNFGYITVALIRLNVKIYSFVFRNFAHRQVNQTVNRYENVISAVSTVGQRKKVTAVTFFPARPRSDQRGTNTGQIRKVPGDEIAWFLVYRMDETSSQLSANNGILVYLVREIWQFKVFAGKEVTALHATRGYWRWGRRLLCLCWNWIALSFYNNVDKSIAYVSPVGDPYQ